MAVSRKQKEEILTKLVDRFDRSKSVVFAANTGLSVEEMSELRKLLRENGVEFQIAKKTLLLRACAKSEVEGVSKEMLDGPVGAAFSFEDEVAAAKLLAKFAKDHKNLVLVAGVMEGKAVEKESIVALSKLPSKEELIAKFIGSLISPLSGFVGIGNGLVGGFVRVLDGVREQKENES